MAGKFGAATGLTKFTGGRSKTGSSVKGEYSQARAANEKRYAQIMAIWDEQIRRAQPGGAFEKASLKEIGKITEQQTASNIGKGMANVTMADPTVGARLKLEDIMEQRLSAAQIGKAGAIERREDVYPDVGQIASYAAQGGGGGVVSGGTDISSYQRRFAESRGGVGRQTTAGPGVATATVGSKGISYGKSPYTPGTVSGMSSAETKKYKTAYGY